MMRRHSSPRQLPLQLSNDTNLDLARAFEARVAQRAEAEAMRWRFRLVLIETAMISLLVLASGFALGQPAGLVLRGAAMVGAGCFLTGLMLIGLTWATSRLLVKFGRKG
ncbi:hypothetical protein [uncultured Sphingomonas sp.]|uniref:hypothetical protein n=1 Tax=uncultured Sphingomonas sp. TaxID=158754 RepID=UPI00260A0F26|nr:hypothetical protein [uncultured Sphingomonas sp.]